MFSSLPQVFCNKPVNAFKPTVLPRPVHIPKQLSRWNSSLNLSCPYLTEQKAIAQIRSIYNPISKLPEDVSYLMTLGAFLDKRLGEVYTNDTRTTVGTSQILFCGHRMI